MEISLLSESNDIIKKHVCTSKSSHLPLISIADELVLDEQRIRKCEHFSIRGYVSEARNQDAEICWPFSMFNHTSKGEVHILPPLTVNKFRRWNCQSCLHKEVAAPEATQANGAVMTDENNGLKNGSTLLHEDTAEASHLEATKAFHTKSTSIGEKLARVEKGELFPVSCCSKKEDASLTSGLIKGIKECKDGHNSSNEDLNLMKKACQIGKNGEGNMRVKSTTLTALLADNSSKILSSKPEGTSVVRTERKAISDKLAEPLNSSVAAFEVQQNQELSKLGKRKEFDNYVAKEPRPLRGAAAIQEAQAFPSSVMHKSHHDTTVPLMAKTLSKPSGPMQKSHLKKSRKVRFLDDIIRSEKLQQSENVSSSSADRGSSGTGSMKTPDTSEQTDEYHSSSRSENNELHSSLKTKKYDGPSPKTKKDDISPSRSNLVTLDTEASLIIQKNRTEAIQGEGSCLINWLKKAPKSAVLRKGDAEAKQVNNADGTFKFGAEEDEFVKFDFSGQRQKKHETIGIMTGKSEVVKSSSIPPGRSVTRIAHVVTEDQMKSSHFKAAGSMTSRREGHHILENEDIIHMSDSVRLKKNKRRLSEDKEAPFQIEELKDSLSKHEQSGLRANIEVKKKLRTVRMPEQAAADDIPMDIVELLARKQQEKHLLNTKSDNVNLSRLPEMIESIDISGTHGRKVLNASDRSFREEESQFSIKGFGAWTSVRDNRNPEYRSKAFDSCSRTKQYHDIDLNKEAPACTSAEIQEPSRYTGLSINGGQLSIFESNKNHIQENFCTNGVKMLAFCSDQMNRTVSSQNIFGNVHYGSSGTMNGYSSGINASKAYSDFSSNNICFEMNSRGIPQNAAYQTWMNPSTDNNEPSRSQETLSDKSFAEARSGYHSNLLRLVHQSARSGEPCNSSIQNDPTGFVQAFNSNISQYPWSGVDVQGCSHGVKQHTGNLHKPLRPLPRVGVLGPLLQNEIANTSSCSTLPLGFGARNISKMPTQETNLRARNFNRLACTMAVEKDKAEVPPLATSMKVADAHSCISQYDRNERIDSSCGFSANPRCSAVKDKCVQVVASSRDGAFQPLRKPEELGECVLNRNPADFAMPDEDSEYMIGYQEDDTRETPHSQSLQLQRTHLDSEKGKKARNVNDLKRSRMSKMSLLSRSGCPPDAK